MVGDFQPIFHLNTILVEYKLHLLILMLKLYNHIAYNSASGIDNYSSNDFLKHIISLTSKKKFDKHIVGWTKAYNVLGGK